MANRILKYYISQPIVQNSLLGVGPFLMATSAWEKFTG